jgi:FAD:protein FMN transferase
MPAPEPPAGHATSAPSLSRVDDYFLGRFAAMGSPCELLVDTDDRAEAGRMLRIAEGEARRMEAKYSRYRCGTVIDRINRAQGTPVQVDQETALLLNYATLCHEMSDGMFDITTGLLRRVWKFDGGDHVPPQERVDELLCMIGWHRVRWEGSTLTMPAEMEIDLGGLGKEYAVDRAAGLVACETARPFLVNFGGDIFASGPRRDGRPWGVGVDDPQRTGEAVLYRVDLARGGLATSGDARRFVRHAGRRLGHILNPKTGWPVEGAPRSVTVIDRTCLEAGTLSTLAYLHGPGARAFLEQQGVEFQIL